MIHLPAVFFVLFWIFADLIGVLLSVISTYFYFGWEGMALLVPKIFGIALLTFSSPLAYGLLLKRFKASQLQRGLLLLSFFMYLALAVSRQSDFFAWGVVATTFVTGLGIMASLRSLGQYHFWSLPLYSLVLSLFFYLSTRIAQSGLPLILSAPQGVGLSGWATLGVFVLAGVFLPENASGFLGQRPQADPESRQLPRWAGSLGLVFGLLSGLSVGLVANLHLWSAQTEPTPAAAYFCPLALGSLLAWLSYRQAQAYRQALIVVYTLVLGAALIPLLYQGYNLPLGLLSCLAASTGLFGLWAFFLGRWREYQLAQPEFFPFLYLQGGFVALLLILAVFLLKANPNGFWLALLGSSGILLAHEAKASALETKATSLDRLWYFSSALFAVMGLAALLVPIPLPPAEAVSSRLIKVMTSNIRYGWSDDYRFDPLEHPRWLKKHLPDLLGLEEVNKGHTSGAYSDDFRLYQKLIPGSWIYGDAHFGFGNALFSRYPLLSYEVRPYQAKDMLKRSCLVATIQVGKQPVEVFVTHLSHLEPPNPVREAQAAELKAWLKSARHPWILLGDFNATPDSPEIRQILEIAHPLLRQQPKLLQEYSFPAAKPTRRIDYIFFSEDFNLKKMQVLNNGVSSDHRPIYAELELKAAQQEAPKR